MDILGIVDIPIWFILLVAITFMIYSYATRPYHVFTNLNIPGPKPSLLFGNLLQEMKLGFHVAHQQWVKKYGKIVGFYEGRHPCLLVTDRDILKHVLVKDFKHFTNRRPLGAISGYPLSDGIMQQRDDDWKRSRSILTPTFSSAKLKKMCELTQTCSANMVDNFQKLADQGEDVDIRDPFTGFTLDVIASAAFGLEIDSQKDPDNPFIKHSKLHTKINFAGVLFMSYFLVPELLPALKLLKLTVAPKAAVEFFLDVVTQAVNGRKSGEVVRPDLLQLMVNAHNEDVKEEGDGDDSLSSHLDNTQRLHKKGLTTTEILAHSITFFLAGNETTSSTMAFTAYNLALNQHWQDRVAMEIQDVLGEDLPTYDNISKLQVLEMCLQESLRLYPPAVRIERECADNTVINGVCIPKNTMVIAPIYAMNRDPDVFPDPDKFNPERFRPENRSHMSQFDFMPFGMGPRSCIGMRMAMMEAKMGLARVLQKFKFVRSSKTQVPLTFRKSTLLQPEHGIWMRVEKRV